MLKNLSIVFAIAVSLSLGEATRALCRPEPLRIRQRLSPRVALQPKPVLFPRLAVT